MAGSSWCKGRRRNRGTGSSLVNTPTGLVDQLAEQPYRQAEEDRLLYVAATRAREMLIVSRWTGNQTLRAWGVLNNFLASAQELPVPQSVPVPSLEPLDSSDQAQSESSVTRLASHDRVRQPSWSIGSVTADAKHIVRTMCTADAAADDPTKVVSADTPTHRADAGMAWGTLMHGLLEHAMRHRAATREDLRRLGDLVDRRRAADSPLN